MWAVHDEIKRQIELLDTQTKIFVKEPVERAGWLTEIIVALYKWSVKERFELT